jgi:hypothetical protein
MNYFEGLRNKHIMKKNATVDSSAASKKFTMTLRSMSKH